MSLLAGSPKEVISGIQVLKSNAGYYIGRLVDYSDGWQEPYDRLAEEYYSTREQAETALENKIFTPRYYEMDAETRDMVYLFLNGK